MRADFEVLAQIGATEDGGISRLALSVEDIEARQYFADRAEAAGLIIHDDDAGNLSAILPAHKPAAPTLLVGSHLDSVPNGGRYDGTVGIIAGLECLRTLRETGVKLPVNLEVIDFTDDEGTWQPLFGARALAGALTFDDMQRLRSENGAFRAAMKRSGIEPDAIYRAGRAPGSVVGYLELHVEQGPRLAREQIDVGVVTGIVGRTTYRITFHGQAGHSGTTDMYKRRDALRGAALFIVRAHETVRAKYGDGIFNCADVEVEPGAFNIIPSRACLRMEFRHTNEALMTEMEAALLSIARECAAANGLEVETELMEHRPAADMAAGVIHAIESACDSLELSHMRMYSYSGHSPQILSKFTPSGLIFIPSVNGVSHHPQEFTEWYDVVNGANVLLQTILNVTMGE